MFAGKVIVQGITGTQGRLQTPLMRAFGTDIVAGVSPGRAGQAVDGVPVYDTVKAALREHVAKWSVILVPARFAKSAAMEALDAGLDLIWITEHVPVHDTLDVLMRARRLKRKVIGPNCPGIAVPGVTKMGIMPNAIFSRGDIGVLSRSGTLCHEVVNSLTEAGKGQSVVIGVGGDPVIGMRLVDAVRFLNGHRGTKRIVMMGEVGGSQEREVAEYVKKNGSKPITAFVAGVSAPPGKAMGHAGAIAGEHSSAKEKIGVLEAAGIKTVSSLEIIPGKV